MFFHSNCGGCGWCRSMYIVRRMRAPLSLVCGVGLMGICRQMLEVL